MPILLDRLRIVASSSSGQPERHQPPLKPQYLRCRLTSRGDGGRRKKSPQQISFNGAGRIAADPTRRFTVTDLILMDVQLPRIFGFEATGGLRRGRTCGASRSSPLRHLRSVVMIKRPLLSAAMDILLSRTDRASAADN
jgi:CheY-like chemotaxis protein